ncbi:SDR family oxidoreductase [Mesobacillus foraminis]|uniref:SDR family oxidoreductase n=1 Tax=Mesobacillus foraminis TaxID=279826 RepID=UPI0039A288CC
MDKKIAIVTGSSSGFGLLCVLELAKAGFEVIATMRNTGKAKSVLDEAARHDIENSIHIQPLDVTSMESIDQFKDYLNTLESVDLLVNNAGFAMGGFSEEVSVEEYRRQFETNFFGVIGVTQAALPFMRRKGSGKIINMSSISGRIGFPGLSPYASSKHALEGYSESLRLELKPMGIDVVLVEPGSYKTSIWSGMDEIIIRADSPYRSFMESLKTEVEKGKADHGNPEDVAKLVTRIAMQPTSPDLRYPIGKGVKRNLLIKSLAPWKVIEAAILGKLIKTK